MDPNRKTGHSQSRRIVLYEGVDHGDEDNGGKQYYEGHERLCELIIGELETRGFSKEEISGIIIYGYDASKDEQERLNSPVSPFAVEEMHELLDGVRDSEWTVVDQAWKGCYDVPRQRQIGRPTLAICRPEAFDYDYDRLRHVMADPYRDGSAVVLEVELETVSDYRDL